MRTRFIRTTSLIITLCMEASTRAARVSVPQDLERAVSEYDAAQVQGNASELRRLLADDYTLVNSNGIAEDKTQLIADYTAPGFKLQPYKVKEPIVRIWTNGAVFSGTVQLSGTNDGKPFEGHLRFADVWRKQGGRWQVIFTHAAR